MFSLQDLASARGTNYYGSSTNYPDENYIQITFLSYRVISHINLFCDKLWYILSGNAYSSSLWKLEVWNIPNGRIDY